MSNKDQRDQVVVDLTQKPGKYQRLTGKTSPGKFYG